MPSAKEIKNCRDALKKEYNMFDGTANWVRRKSDGNEYVESTHMACHAAMQRQGENAYKGLVGTENAARREWSEDKDYKNLSLPFLSWFLYESPYGEVILNRDDLEFCRDYGFIIPFNVPQPLFMNACIISRHFKECNPHSFVLFNRLVKDGIDPFLVYNVVFNSNLYSYNEDIMDAAVWSPYSGHRVCKSYDYDSILRYYKGDKGPKTKMEPMSKARSIYGASVLFRSLPLVGFKDNNETFHSWYSNNKKAKQAVREYRHGPEAKKQYRPPNPFKTVKYTVGPNESNFTFGELKIILPILQAQIEKELANG